MGLELPTIAHFSYIRETDVDIMSKIRSFMHSGDTDWEQWFDKYYRNFDIRMKNFHPVCPSGWRHLSPFDLCSLPPVLRGKLAEQGKLYDFTRAFPAPLPPQELHDRALCLVAENRPGEAIEALENLIQLYPGYTPARNDLALLYYDSGDRANALRQFELSSRESPGRSSVLTNLANLYCELGNIGRAMDSCREIIELHPRNTEALVNLGNLSSLAGSKEPALSCYAQALAIDPHNAGARRGISALSLP
jgi:tetratricopeptide (TPR) repeat protein